MPVLETIHEAHESITDDELMAQLDEHHKWEIRTDDAQFDTHYHTLREALTCTGQLSGKTPLINGVSKFDGTILVEREQMVRILKRVGLAIPTDVAD